MDIEIKTFDELDSHTLYRLLQLRSEVFVVEQDCVYQDIDGKDQKAWHVLGYKEQQLLAYARVFAPGGYFKEASIGRVVVSEKIRGVGAGYDIMNATVDFIEKHLKKPQIRISAQLYLKDFYNKLGFKEEGDSYLKDGIPHINMLKE